MGPLSGAMCSPSFLIGCEINKIKKEKSANLKEKGTGRFLPHMRLASFPLAAAEPWACLP
jgi:hypothetical protein